MPHAAGMAPDALKALISSIGAADPSFFSDVNRDVIVEAAAALRGAAVGRKETTKHISWNLLYRDDFASSTG